MKTNAVLKACSFFQERSVRRFILSIMCLAMLLLNACQQDDDEPDPQSTPGSGVVRPTGTPEGDPVVKEISAEGGIIATEDGTISINIPSGALSENTTITLQPITNTNVSGKKTAYRITPHGAYFKKDVSITFSYTSDEIANSIPEALGIAFQDSTGVWQSVGGIVLDKNSNKITVSTNHFSDWSLFERFWIEPWAANVDPGGTVDLKVVSVDPDLTAPMPKGETRDIDEPYEVKENFIKEWNLEGEGILGGLKNYQTYMAPGEVPQRNPVTVSAELNLPGPGKYLLVCNITIGKPPHINYLQVDEEFSQLYIYGSGFLQGNGDDLAITIDGVPVKGIVMNADAFIQCWIPETGKGSSGPVQVVSNGAASNKHVLNEWNGAFVYNRPCAGNAGSLYQKIVFNVRLRGDADPDMTVPMEVDPFINRSRLNKGSTAKYEAGGEGKTYFDNEEACGSDYVRWAKTEGFAPFVYNYDADVQVFFTGEIETKVSGFDLRLDFRNDEAIPTRYTYTDCQGDSHTEDYYDEIYFIFSSYNDVLKLLFKDDSSLTGGRLVANAGLARNIHFNVWDVPANIREATLEWGPIAAKYPNGIITE